MCCIHFKNEPGAEGRTVLDLRKELTTVQQLPGNQGVELSMASFFIRIFKRTANASSATRSKAPAAVSRTCRMARACRGSPSRSTDPPRIDPASEEIVLTFLQGGHNGGDLHFGPDRMLYISTGDAASPNPPDPLNTGQDISDLLSSILRIDVDHKDRGKNYAIPKDNPFVANGQLSARNLGLWLSQSVADEL